MRPLRRKVRMHFSARFVRIVEEMSDFESRSPRQTRVSRRGDRVRARLEATRHPKSQITESEGYEAQLPQMEVFVPAARSTPESPADSGSGQAATTGSQTNEEGREAVP